MNDTVSKNRSAAAAAAAELVSPNTAIFSFSKTRTTLYQALKIELEYSRQVSKTANSPSLRQTRAASGACQSREQLALQRACKSIFKCIIHNVEASQQLAS